MARFSVAQLTAVATQALARAGANQDMATVTAIALVDADAQGLASHGTSRIPRYAAHLRNGRADGAAVPRVVRENGAVALVDAAYGLAFPACALALDRAIALSRTSGVGVVGVTRSHHFGVAAYHLVAVAEAGLIGLAFSNSPAAMAAAGGKRAIFGTNPIAAAFPRKDEAPLMIDLSLSEAARGKVMIAANKGQSIPEGWALGRDGKPTTDPHEALAGTMVAMGGNKGAMLALIVELLVTALTGASLSFEADSFLVDEGRRPGIGHAFLVIDPAWSVGRDVYVERMEALLAEMQMDEGVRLPGSRRRLLAARAAQEGIEIPDALAAQLASLAGI